MINTWPNIDDLISSPIQELDNCEIYRVMFPGEPISSNNRLPDMSENVYNEYGFSDDSYTKYKIDHNMVEVSDFNKEATKDLILVLEDGFRQRRVIFKAIHDSDWEYSPNQSEIYMTADLLQRLSLAASDDEKTWIITEALLNSLPEDLAIAVKASAIPHWFNANILAALLQINIDQAKEIYSEIQKLSYSEIFGNDLSGNELGYQLHDLTRRSIINNLKTNQPEFFRLKSQIAFDYFNRIDDFQHEIESTYHLLAFAEQPGIARARYQFEKYLFSDSGARFSAMNNLTRNINELGELKLI